MPHRNGRVGNRAVLAERAATLRGEGKLLREIAEALDISYSYTQCLIYDPTRMKEAARKASYRRPCVDCGTLTGGSDGVRDEPRCTKCAPLHYGPLNTKWTEARIIASVQWWVAEFGVTPAIADWNPNMARVRLHDEERAVRFERLFAEERVPWFTSVVFRFGTFNKGIAAAGFEPNENHGTRASVKRKRNYKGSAESRKWPTNGREAHIMDALVLRKDGTGWVEVGTTEARSYLDAVENIADEPGEYIAVPSSQVFVVAPVNKLAASMKSA